MSATTAVAACVQLVGGVALAPLLPGLVQHLKGRLQGRRGPSPLQPYRELRRLWRKSVVDPEGTTALFKAAPSVVAASAGLALLLLPVGGVGPDWSLGHDALVLVGLFALARFALAVSAWDTGSGFGLMAVSRELTLAVFAEGLLLLVIALAVLPVESTDLRALTAAASGSAIWSHPFHWCGAVAFALVVLVETGRQPVDNPDTHLELTMIHEGPLLEYAGRDLALLQWAAAARHWIVLVLAADLFLPHGGSFAVQLVELALEVVALCGALALVETWQAKLRILWVPRLLGAGGALALIGFVSFFIGGRL
ncbi:MAG TPA: NADH-quinone oxidoreductase subunit H [Gaiellaceae bacterium]|nr:NADH-quinone oxidoreductase subunit H [Gaiellaceae bacterium]